MLNAVLFAFHKDSEQIQIVSADKRDQRFLNDIGKDRAVGNGRIADVVVLDILRKIENTQHEVVSVSYSVEDGRIHRWYVYYRSQHRDPML